MFSSEIVYSNGYCALMGKISAYIGYVSKIK